MGENLGQNKRKITASDVALICLLGMVAGFLLSRVALSVFTFLYGVNALWNINPRKWLKQKYWLLSVAWVLLYVVTWFWSNDKGYWEDRFQVKFALLLMPLAFALAPRLSIRQWQQFTLLAGAMFCGAAAYSMSFLLHNYSWIMFIYRVGDTLPTLPKYDHVRCSLAMALYVIWGINMFPSFALRWQRIVLAAMLLFITVYIHYLAAKSGLLCIYLFVIGFGIYFMVSKRRILLGIGVLLLLPLLYELALTFIPTFHQRKDYVAFSLVYRLHDKTGNYGDIGRLLSYDVAGKIIARHPLAGVGAGEMLHAMKAGYAQWYPEVVDTAVLLPHNQFLTVALGCGIPAMLVFAWWVLAPLGWIRKNRAGFFFFMAWLVLSAQLMIEPMLEVQFGVFVYLFYILIFRQILFLESDNDTLDKTKTA